MPEPQWLDRDLVDALHDQSLSLHGGLAGVRDVHVLEAAIASPRNLWAYDREENLFRLAAHLLVSLAKAHAYSDGNKRIAIISAVAFLGGNGIELSIGAGELVPQTIRAARCQKQDRALEGGGHRALARTFQSHEQLLMNENHSAFDQRFEAGKSIIDALEISAARRAHLEPKPDQEDVRPHSEQKPISDSP